MTTKASLHQLIDTLPDTELEAAERYLLFLREMADPVRRALLTAPWDDEPETEEERKAVQDRCLNFPDNYCASGPAVYQGYVP
ncbi:MAG: hypothetical protein M3361_12610 [Candidatus Tectomicrobia bacterium]|jgi:hypothetical protein|nr:hypothetical protein [Candidatus Tectomicrobia bacterium]